MSTTPVSEISGNAPDKVKAIVGDLDGLFRAVRGNNIKMGSRFGDSILLRFKVAEVSINKKAEEPKKLEGRVVVETVVEEGEDTFRQLTIIF